MAVKQIQVLSQNLKKIIIIRGQLQKLQGDFPN